MRMPVPLRPALLLLASGLAACEPAGVVERPIHDIRPPTEAEARVERSLADARRLFGADEPRKAEPLLREVLAARPENAAAWELLGRILIGGRRRDEGIAALEKAVSLDASRSEARDLLFRARYHAGDYDDAVQVARAWARHDPDEEQPLFRLGQVLYAQGELQRARKALRRAARLRHSRADIRSELGLVEQALGSLEEAEAQQHNALERDPKLAKAWFRLGTVVTQRDPSRAVEALDAFDRALDLDADLVNAHLYRYRLLVLRGETGDDAAARSSWTKVISAQAERQLAWYALGSRPKRVRDSAERERELERQAMSAPDDPAPRAELARLLHGQGHIQDALEWYAKWIAVNESDAAAHAGRGAALLWAHRFDEAEPALRQALLLAPEDQRTRRQLAWLLLSDDRAKEALAEYDALLTRFPADRLGAKGRALATMAAGDIEAGLRAIAAAGWL